MKSVEAPTWEPTSSGCQICEWLGSAYLHNQHVQQNLARDRATHDIILSKSAWIEGLRYTVYIGIHECHVIIGRRLWLGRQPFFNNFVLRSSMGYDVAHQSRGPVRPCRLLLLLLLPLLLLPPPRPPPPPPTLLLPPVDSRRLRKAMCRVCFSSSAVQ